MDDDRAPGGEAAGGRPDEGFTLVEMLVALFIVSSSLLALLAGFLASASSLRSQEARASAVRVGMQQNDKLRTIAYSAVTASTQSVPLNGRTYTVVTTVTEVDSRPGMTVPGDTVKRVSTVVSWTLGGQTRSVTLATAIAPPATGTTGTTTSPSSPAAASITAMSINPDTVGVDANGRPTEVLNVRLAITNYSGTARIGWTDDTGPHEVLASSTDGVNWRFAIPTDQVTKRVSAGSTVDLDFRATLSSGTSASAAVQLVGPAPATVTPLSITCSVSPNAVSVNGSGKNQVAVANSCTVGGIPVAAALTDYSVSLSYVDAGNNPKSVGLNVDPLDRTKWSQQFARQDATFATGSRMFTFTVRSQSNATSPVSHRVPVTVTR